MDPAGCIKQSVKLSTTSLRKKLSKLEEWSLARHRSMDLKKFPDL